LESECPQGLKSSLDEKDKLIQSLKKNLKMSTIEHPQPTESVSLEQEKKTLCQEKGEMVTRVEKISKKGCSCSSFCKSWVKH
jgi:hypothetical protein